MKILVADDHQLFLDGLNSILQSLSPDAQITQVISGPDTLESLAQTEFDIALIDLRLPGVNGLQILTELNQRGCLVPVIIVTASEDPADKQAALELGAMGFVSKSSSGACFIEVIQRVLKGEVACCDQQQSTSLDVQGDGGSAASGEPSSAAAEDSAMPASTVPAPAASNPDWASQHQITPRQFAVLRLMSRGLSNQDIADQMYISNATVKSHVSAIFQALGAKNRTQAVEQARRLGMN